MAVGAIYNDKHNLASAIRTQTTQPAVMTDTPLAASARRHYEAAILLHRQNRLAEANQHYLAALQAHPNHPGILHGLGVLCVHSGRIGEAADYFRRASASAPHDATLHNYGGLTLARLGRHEEAAVAFEAALQCQPGFFEALIGLGDSQLRLGRYEGAIRSFEAALAQRPAFVPALLGLADALSIVGRSSEAQRAYETLLAVDSNSAAAHFGIGNIMKQQGRFSEAQSAYEHAVALAPTIPAFHRALAEARPFSDGDARLAALEALARDEKALSDDQKVELNFALAKAYDDLKRFDAAFERLQKGNAIKRRLVAYDEKKILEFFRDVADAFTPAILEANRGAGHPTDAPVFIVGMPRSGTTLVEQILASHPDVYGAGELTLVQDLILEGLAGGEYPADLASLPRDAFHRFGDRYFARISALAPQAKRITDKLPANFRHLGLIHLALPNARIIHVRRDPLDTCFSCYSKLFLSGLNYTYDLGELGRYYKAYETLMAHWRAALPSGTMLEVPYETLVANIAGTAPRIVEFCGLEWDERCLSFYETERAVRTLSEFQVRRPAYTSSIGRSRAYARRLQPLLDTLR